MARKGVKATVLLLCLALPLIFLSGCGSESEESYGRELQELSERLSAELREIAGEASGEHHAEDAETPSSLGATFSEMADLLEEGAWELSRLKVPAGRESLQSSLLELLRSTSTVCREMAYLLLPSSQGHSEEGDTAHGGEHVDGNGAKEAGEEGAEHGAETETEGSPEEGHGH